MKSPIVVAGVALLAVAGCGSAASAHPAQSPAAGNVRVCEHYRTQRARLLNNATPTLATAVQVAVWVAADAAQAAPGTPLARDLGAMVAAMRHDRSTDAAIRRVHADCQALGVPISR